MAAPPVREVIRQTLAYLGVPPDKDPSQGTNVRQVQAQIHDDPIASAITRAAGASWAGRPMCYSLSRFVRSHTMPTQEAAGNPTRHAVPLKDLLARALEPGAITSLFGAPDVPIQQVTDDSRQVEPGGVLLRWRARVTTAVPSSSRRSRAARPPSSAMPTTRHPPRNPPPSSA